MILSRDNVLPDHQTLVHALCDLYHGDISITEEGFKLLKARREDRYKLLGPSPLWYPLTHTDWVIFDLH